MKEQIEERLGILQAEFKSGQEILTDLEQKQVHVRNTLVRISGAIQVLEELLNRDTPAPPLSDLAPELASAATS